MRLRSCLIAAVLVAALAGAAVEVPAASADQVETSKKCKKGYKKVKGKCKKKKKKKAASARAELVAVPADLIEAPATCPCPVTITGGFAYKSAGGRLVPVNSVAAKVTVSFENQTLSVTTARSNDVDGWSLGGFTSSAALGSATVATTATPLGSDTGKYKPGTTSKGVLVQ